jgi:hypothetical protein
MKCVVCGADVTKSRIRRDEYVAKNDTCDPICTRAKHGGRTREEQFWEDDRQEALLGQDMREYPI